MGLKDLIIGFLLDGIKVPKALLVEHIDEIDADHDGYISMREVWDVVKTL